MRQDLQHVMRVAQVRHAVQNAGLPVSNVAARIGSAEFFEPLILIEPESGRPP